MYHTNSSATDMVPEGHSCQGLVRLRGRRWKYQPPTAGDEVRAGQLPAMRLLADGIMRRPACDGAQNNPHQILNYLLHCFLFRQQRHIYHPDVHNVIWVFIK